MSRTNTKQLVRMKIFYFFLLAIFTSTIAIGQDTLVEVGQLGPTVGMCQMATPAIGFGVRGNKDVVLTSDSGKTWTKKAILGYTSPYDINCLGVASTKRAIVGLDSGGRTYVTSDGGITWTPIQIGANKHVSSIQFMDSLNAYAVLNGNSGSVDTPYIYKTTNGGDSWEFMSKVGKPTFNAKIAFDKNSPNIVYLPISSDDSLLYRSVDSARTWTAIPLPFDVANDNFVYSFGDTSVYLYGGYRALYYSNDGGQSWDEKFTIPNVYKAKDFVFTQPDKGYVFSYYSGSYNSRLYEISHFGDSLNLVAIEPNAWTYFFANSDENNFLFHGNNGRVFTWKKTGIISSSLPDLAATTTIFPNPATESFSIINLKNSASIKIISLEGKTLLVKNLSGLNLGAANVDISNLQAGNYIVVITSKNEVSSYQLVKL